MTAGRNRCQDEDQEACRSRTRSSRWPHKNTHVQPLPGTASYSVRQMGLASGGYVRRTLGRVLAAALVLAACGLTPPTKSLDNKPTPGVTASAATAPSPRTTTTPSGVEGVEVRPMGPLRGEVAFVQQEVVGRTGPVVIHLYAVELASRDVNPVLTYRRLTPG